MTLIAAAARRSSLEWCDENNPPTCSVKTDIKLMQRFSLLVVGLLLVSLLLAGDGRAAQAKGAKKAEPKTVRVDHEVRTIEGWRVHVDKALLKGPHQREGDLAMKVLAQRLHQIIMRLPDEAVKQMQKVPIYMDHDHPLGAAHFHPSADWLEEHGYDPAMANAVHLTNTGLLLREASRPGAGWVVLHELAHAYHFRVLGFDNKEVAAGYKKFCDSGKFDIVPYADGHKRPHYALTNPMEYFAEMTETLFLSNDFYPFHHVELMREAPDTYELIARMWGAKHLKVVKHPETRLGIQDLRILATLKSQRGEHDEALKLIDQALKRSPGNGRLLGVREEFEEAKAAAKNKAAKP